MKPSWLRLGGNDRGEWSVADLWRDYRVCTYNHAAHGGAHIHHPLDAPAEPLPVALTRRQATAAVVAYAGKFEYFDALMFLDEVKRWRSL